MKFKNNVMRRDFLRCSAAALAIGQLPGLVSPAQAIEPVVRGKDQILKLSLAAYSLIDFFKHTHRGPGKGDLDMTGFVDYCAKLGLTGAEITQYFFAPDVTREDLFALKRHAHLRGVDLTSGAIGNNFTAEPGEALDKQMEYVKTWIHHYADLGVPVIRVFAGKPPKGMSEEVALQRAIKGIRAACEIAAERGVMLGIENHDFTTKIDRLFEIIKAVDSPWLGVNFDSGNLDHSEDPYADMERIAPYAVNAQIKVMINQASGTVEADLDRTVKILRDANYSGYLVLEYEEDNPYENIPKYVEKLQKLIQA